MASINKVILLGSVGTIEVKEKVVQISLATSSGYKKKDSDEWVNKTEWHRLIFAIPTLVDKAKNIKKGDSIYVEGSINTNSWTTKEGEKKEIKEIAVVTFMTMAKAKTPEREYNQPKTTITEQVINNNVNEDDDLPFN
jgi:single-strand DNA-binding protein